MINSKSSIQFLFLIILLSSCCKAIITNSWFIENKSSVKISLIPYKDGVIFESTKIELLPNEKYFGGINFPADSIVLIYNNNFSVSHYFTKMDKKLGYEFDSERNILNSKNYEINRIETSRCGSIEVNTFFKISEADYLYAKNIK